MDVVDGLRGGGRTSSVGRGSSRTRAVLVVTEFALAMILLTGAGLLIRSFWKLSKVSPGFQAAQLTGIDISLADRKYQDDAERIRFNQQLLREVRGIQGVQSAATVYGLPFSSMAKDLYPVSVEGRPTPPKESLPLAGYRQASPDYFHTLGVPILKGREFDDRDDSKGPLRVIVNEAFAKSFFPAADPIGKRIIIHFGREALCEIVGVVGNTKSGALEESSRPEIYRPEFQVADWYVSLVVRTMGPFPDLERKIREAVRRIDPDRPIYNFRSMESEMGRVTRSRRATLFLLCAFAGVAVSLAMIGIYAVVSYSVQQRTREVGIRMALGAEAKEIHRMILGNGLRFAAWGVVFGIAGNLVVGRFISAQLYGTAPDDLPTLTGVAVTLVAVALGACYLPARRAASVEPITILRQE
jgi:putative ABC transport system permease protein